MYFKFNGIHKKHLKKLCIPSRFIIFFKRYAYNFQNLNLKIIIY